MADSADQQRTMRAWRTHRYGPRPTEVLQLDQGAHPRAPGRRGAGPRAGDPAQPERPRAHQRRQHDGAARAALQPRHGGDGRRRRAAARATEALSREAAWSRCRSGAHGGFAEYAICPGVSAFEMPEEIPLPDAAALYFPFHLAWLGLVRPRRAPRRRDVLIHAAAGGVGSAAIQLAVHAGRACSRPRAARTKLALCRELGAARRDQLHASSDFAPIVLEATETRGVDVVFDNVGEAVMEQSIELHRLQRALPHDGLRVGQDVSPTRSSIVPRRIALGQLQALRRPARLRASTTMAQMLKKGMGWNFASDRHGAADHARDPGAGDRRSGSSR